MFKSLAIVGATGAVGREMARLLGDHLTEITDVLLLASERSAGRKLTVRGQALEVGVLAPRSLEGVDLALFSAGREISRRFGREAAAGGTMVVDNSSAFRMEPGVPLVVPEINPQHLAGHRNLIANPNCSTIILAVVLWPLHRAHPIRRVVVSTYQAASGAGYKAMRELETQTAALLAGRQAEPEVFDYPCAFNLFSHNSAIDAGGYNEEERKMVQETRKIFGEPNFALTATCIRVPVLRAHCESVNITFAEPVDEGEVRDLLAGAPGVRVVDDRSANHFPMPCEASEQDDVLVGRIRRDASQADGCGIELFLCGDQLRKGAALNAVQIAEALQRIDDWGLTIGD
jgi:aspartate-semialdehyde dehydrogenase